MVNSGLKKLCLSGLSFLLVPFVLLKRGVSNTTAGASDTAIKIGNIVPYTGHFQSMDRRDAPRPLRRTERLKYARYILR